MPTFKAIVLFAFIWFILGDVLKNIDSNGTRYTVTVKGTIILGIVASILAMLLHNWVLGILCAVVGWMILHEIYARLEN